MHKDLLLRDIKVGDYVAYVGQVYTVIKTTTKSVVIDRVVFKRKTKPQYVKSDACVLLSPEDVMMWMVGRES